MNKHRDLEAWQVCRSLAQEVYRATASLPADERFGLTAQLRRAAISPAANIAEGNARRGPRELVHALSIALGSLAEIDTLLAVCEDLNYLNAAELKSLHDLRDRASQVTFGLYRRIRR